MLLVGIFVGWLAIKFGEQNWRHTMYCRHCGKFYDQPVGDPTDWRNDEEKAKHFN